jgi:hypothetical protein
MLLTIFGPQVSRLHLCRFGEELPNRGWESAFRMINRTDALTPHFLAPASLMIESSEVGRQPKRTLTRPPYASFYSSP